jgi:Domain of unknown function (DUF397)
MVQPIQCGTNCCVDVKATGDGVNVTSTIDGNDGAVTFTNTEWNGFLDQVKRGEWDHTDSRTWE